MEAGALEREKAYAYLQYIAAGVFAVWAFLFDHPYLCMLGGMMFLARAAVSGDD